MCKLLKNRRPDRVDIKSIYVYSCTNSINSKLKCQKSFICQEVTEWSYKASESTLLVTISAVITQTRLVNGFCKLLNLTQYLSNEIQDFVTFTAEVSHCSGTS